MAVAIARSRDSAAFGRLFGVPGRRMRVAELVGLEHEFIARNGAEVVDFRRLIGELPIGGRALDPYDRYARRCAWGGNVTADDWDAEVAIPPIRVGRGFAAEVSRAAAAAGIRLRDALGPEVQLDGYSTHLSFAMPDALNDGVCELFASTFAPGLMLLMDRQESAGLLIHPRRGRVELGAEFVEGRQLRAAVAFAAGGVLACAGALRNGHGALPVAVAGDVVHTVRRFGWFVSRRAFGSDIVAGGRATPLRLVDGTATTSEAHLEAAWAIARRALSERVGVADLRDADAAVGGSLPLPLERLLGSDGATNAATATSGAASPFGALLQPVTRPGFTAVAELATWDFTIVRVEQAHRRAFAAVPRADLARFLAMLQAGRLDGMLRAALSGIGCRPLLTDWASARQPGLFRELGERSAFVPPERAPDGRPWSGSVSAAVRTPTTTDATRSETGAATGTWPRPGKMPTKVTDTQEPGRAGLPVWVRLGVLGVVVALLLGAGVVFALQGRQPWVAPPASLATPTPSASPLPTIVPTVAPTVVRPVVTATPVIAPITPQPSYGVNSSATITGDASGCSFPIRFAWTPAFSSPGYTPSGDAVIMVSGPGIDGTVTRPWGPGGVTLDYMVQVTTTPQTWAGQLLSIGGVAPSNSTRVTVDNLRHDGC